MMWVRTFSAVGLAAALSGCSGNLGGGQSTLPGAPVQGSNVQSVAQAAPTPTPASASNVATVSDAAGAQPLPDFDGWGGTIAFAKPEASPSPSPNAKTPAAADGGAAAPVSVGITASVNEPADAPRFNGSAKHHGKRDPAVPEALFFITLLATSDVTLDAYPRIAVDVPRDVAAKYHDAVFGLAFYDPETKTKSYRLAVAERDLSAPDTGPVHATPVPTPIPTPIPVGSPSAFPFGMAGGPGIPPLGAAGAARSALPPQEIAFVATPAKLALHENQPVFFAFYVIGPSPSPSPSPSPKAGGQVHPSPIPSGTAIPSALPATSPLPAASPAPSASSTSVR